MPRTPYRVGAHKAEWVALERRLRTRDGNDQLQELGAVGLRLLRKFIVDRIAIFGAFPFQKLEGALPNLIAPFAEANNDAGGSPVRLETFAPVTDKLVSTKARHCESPQLFTPSYMDDDELIKLEPLSYPITGPDSPL
jgi:hypothetical protein